MLLLGCGYGLLLSYVFIFIVRITYYKYSDNSVQKVTKITSLAQLLK